MIEYMSVLLEEISDQSELFDADFAILGDDFLISIPKFVKHFRNIDVQGVKCRGSGIFDTRTSNSRISGGKNLWLLSSGEGSYHISLTWRRLLRLLPITILMRLC